MYTRSVTARLRSRVASGLALLLVFSLVPCLCLEAAAAPAAEEHSCCAAPAGLSAAERDCCDASGDTASRLSLVPPATSGDAPMLMSVALISAPVRASVSPAAPPSAALPLVLRI